MKPSTSIYTKFKLCLAVIHFVPPHRHTRLLMGDAVLRFQVVTIDGTPLPGSQLFCHPSSVFNPRSRLVEAEGTAALSLSCLQAVCKYDEDFSNRATVTKRLVYAGPSVVVDGVHVNTGGHGMAWHGMMGTVKALVV